MTVGLSMSGPHAHDAAQRAGEPALETLYKPAACRAPRIVLAEDDVEIRSLLSLSLRQDGYDITEVEDGNELLTQLGAALSYPAMFHFDLVVSDSREVFRLG
jgi:PleD family two-component response regulator